MYYSVSMSLHTDDDRTDTSFEMERIEFIIWSHLMGYINVTDFRSIRCLCNPISCKRRVWSRRKLTYVLLLFSFFLLLRISTSISQDLGHIEPSWKYAISLAQTFSSNEWTLGICNQPLFRNLIEYIWLQVGAISNWITCIPFLFESP